MKRTTLAAWATFGLITLISVWAALLDTAVARQGGPPQPWIIYLVGPVFALVGALILARWLLTAALNYTFLVTFFLVLQWVVSGAANVDFAIRMPVWMAALVAVPLLTTALTVGLLVVGLLGWRRHAWPRRGLALIGVRSPVGRLAPAVR